MNGISIQIEDNASPAVARVQDFLASAGARRIMGAAGNKVVRAHLQELDESRANKIGGTRTHYYGSARRATNYRIEGDGVTVSISQIGMRLHYYGGTVSAGVGISSATGKATKYLTIPASSEAYGKSAASFPDLIVLWGRNGPYALAQAVSKETMTERDGYRASRTQGDILFWLKSSVTMQPDPDVLPDSDEIGTEVTNRLGSAIARRFGGQIAEESEAIDE